MRLVHMAAGAAILLIAALGVNLVSQSAPSWAERSGAPMRTLTVNGEGEAAGRPDQARITAGVSTASATAKDALARNNARMAEVIATLKKLGIAAEDIQTSNFSLNPVYAQQQPGEQGPPRIAGYQVSNSVTVVVNDLAALGGILDQVVQMGSNAVNGIEFTFKDPKSLQGKAREAAVADARARAETYAKAAGVSVGRVLSISETGRAQPYPVAYAARAEASSDVPVEPGSQKLSQSVTVVFAID
jgi:uncharacterized protein YggE